jgi:hypothetical protein
VSLIPNIKKKKGKKKEAAVLPALDRIMGYAGSDMSEEEVRGRRESMWAGSWARHCSCIQCNCLHSLLFSTPGL